MEYTQLGSRRQVYNLLYQMKASPACQLYHEQSTYSLFYIAQRTSMSFIHI